MTAPHFCAGLVILDGSVLTCAPILKYMHGWTEHQVIDYCRRKGWQANRTN